MDNDKIGQIAETERANEDTHPDLYASAAAGLKALTATADPKELQQAGESKADDVVESTAPKVEETVETVETVGKFRCVEPVCHGLCQPGQWRTKNLQPNKLTQCCKAEFRTRKLDRRRRLEGLRPSLVQAAVIVAVSSAPYHS